MIVTAWAFLYLISGVGMSNISGFQTERDCKDVEKQIVAIFKPVKHGCVEFNFAPPAAKQ